jgi:hypothetical protein
MFLKKSVFYIISILLVVSFVFSPEVLGAQVEKKVVFPKGKTSVSYSGRLPKFYADYDAYVLRSKAKRTLTVKLKTTDPKAYITIYETKEFGPDEDMISTGDNLREWSGQLPITSEYSVQVYGTDEGESSRAPYTIEISLR